MGTFALAARRAAAWQCVILAAGFAVAQLFGTPGLARATPAAELRTRYSSRAELQHRTVISYDQRVRLLLSVREQPQQRTVLRAGLGSEHLDLGPVRLRGLHRLVAAPLSLAVSSSAFTETSDVRLDTSLLPATRSGGELRLTAPDTQAHGRVFAHQAPGGARTAGVVLARTGDHSAFDVLASTSAPSEAATPDDWEHERAPHPGGKVQHAALRLAAVTRNMSLGALGAGTARMTTVFGASFGRRIAPGAFLEGQLALEPRELSILARGGMLHSAYRLPDGAGPSSASRRSLDLEVLPRRPAGLEGFVDLRRPATRFYRGDEAPAERRYGGGVRVGRRSEDGVWGRIIREQREFTGHEADRPAERRDGLELRLRDSEHSFGVAVLDRRIGLDVVERRSTVEYEWRGEVAAARTRVRVFIRDQITVACGIRAQLEAGRCELVLTLDTARELPAEAALREVLRTPDEAVIATLALRVRL